jgi:hypothetical protein
MRVVAAGSNGSDDAAPGSMLAALRTRAAEQSKAKTTELVVGGAFGSNLWIRYHLLGVDELDRFAQLGGKIADISLAIEMMVSTCTTLIWRDEHGDKADLGVTFTPALWELMGWPLPDGVALDDLTPREIVVQLFGGNGSALAVHLERLSNWLRDPGGTDPGESLAAT